MNKQQKIIVSIVGITIVLLALLGITYAYYLTRIEGNTNTNSISVTTADLKLEYGDGNGLLTATNIMPGKQVEFKTTNNTTTTEKTFTVTNSGNSLVEGYAVSLDYVYIENIMPSIFERPEDFQITLTCSTNRTGETCNGFNGNFNNESLMMTSNDIDEGEVHTYSLSMYYNDPQVDQSNDMGKNLNLKVQIYNISETTDIEGTITGVDSTYAVRIESEPKMSTIVNGKYNFKGVEIGTHTLTVLDKDGNEVDKEYIVVKSGTTPGIAPTKTTIDNAEVDATGITITKDERVAKLSTKVESNVLTFDTSTSSTGIFNPYSSNKNSLVYNIINNSINNNDGTRFLKENQTGAKEYKIISDNKAAGFSSWSTEICYGDTEDEAKSCTNKITNATDLEMCNSVKNKYIYHEGPALFGLGKVVDCNVDGTPVLSKQVKSYLSTSQDDYGDSYYYIGGVEDNYVNFAGLCWRIVRVAGDGTTKLVLEDASYECNNVAFTGNWSIGTGNYGYNNTTVTNSEGLVTSSKLNIKSYLEPVTNADKSMIKAYYDFQSVLETKINAKYNKTMNNMLKSGDWCISDKIYLGNDISSLEPLDDNISINDVYYDAFTNEKSIGYDYFVVVNHLNDDVGDKTLKCTGTIVDSFKNVMYDNNVLTTIKDMYVGALTAYEVDYSGDTTYYHYLINSHFKGDWNYFWTFTPTEFSSFTNYSDYIFAIMNIGMNYYSEVNNSNNYFRPTINLVNNINIITGEGTRTNPYVIQ